VQGRRRGALDDAHPGPPVAARLAEFHRDHHQCLAQRAAPTDARLVTAEEGLIDLDTSGEDLPAGPDHRGAVAVQHRPRCLVGAQAQQLLHRQRRHPTRIGGHVPGGREPPSTVYGCPERSSPRCARPACHRRRIATPARRPRSSPHARTPDTPASAASPGSPCTPDRRGTTPSTRHTSPDSADHATAHHDLTASWQ